MDRLKFIQKNCNDCIISNFDYIMTVYDILDVYDHKIQTTFNTNTLCFELKLPSEKIANTLTNRLNTTEISNYDSKYKVDARLVGNIINLKLNKVSG